MLTLEKLQLIGALPKKLNIVKKSDYTDSSIITAKIIKQADEEFRNTCEKAIVVDNYKWIAVNDGDSIETANVVYSCNGDNLVGSFNRQRRIFSQRELRGEMLYTVTQIEISNNKKNEKEKQKMAGVDLTNLENMNLNDIEATSVAPVVTDEAKPVSESQKAILDIKAKIQQSDSQVANHDQVIITNQKYGRLIAFITKTDKGIKVSKCKVTKVDGNGNGVLRTDLKPDQLDKVEQAKNNKEIRIPAGYYEKETALMFKESKPSAPIAVIVSTPKGALVDFTSLYSNDTIGATNDTTAEIKIMSMEMFYSFLAGLYDGRIKESDAVLGNRATWLAEKFTQAKAKSDSPDKAYTIRPSIALEDRKARNTVLTTGNYIPLRKFITMSQSEIKTQEDVDKLQYNIEAAFKKQGSYAALRPADQEIIKDNGTKSKYFTTGGDMITISGVKKFDDKETDVANVRIPVRTKKQSKDGTSFTYGYEYEELGENGDLYKADKAVADILAAAKMSVTDFLAEVGKVTKKRSASASKKATISAADYVAVLGRGTSINASTNLSPKDIAAQLAGLNN
jgi:hypothetical protein